jgi:hypothetical protein
MVLLPISFHELSQQDIKKETIAKRTGKKLSIKMTTTQCVHPNDVHVSAG